MKRESALKLIAFLIEELRGDKANSDIYAVLEPLQSLTREGSGHEAQKTVTSGVPVTEEAVEGDIVREFLDPDMNTYLKAWAEKSKAMKQDNRYLDELRGRIAAIAEEVSAKDDGSSQEVKPAQLTP